MFAYKFLQISNILFTFFSCIKKMLDILTSESMWKTILSNIYYFVVMKDMIKSCLEKMLTD